MSWLLTFIAGWWEDWSNTPETMWHRNLHSTGWWETLRRSWVSEGDCVLCLWHRYCMNIFQSLCQGNGSNQTWIVKKIFIYMNYYFIIWTLSPNHHLSEHSASRPGYMPFAYWTQLQESEMSLTRNLCSEKLAEHQQLHLESSSFYSSTCRRLYQVPV